MDQNIAAAIAAATQVAANIPMPGGQALATTTAPAPVAARVRTLDDAIDAAGAAVEEWVQVSEPGVTLNGKPFTEVDAFLKMADIRFMWQVRFNAPSGGTRFARSYNGVTESQSGRSWQQVVSEAQAADPKCMGEYDAAEVPLRLVADLKAGEKVYKAGSLIGFTTPVTGYKPFMSWLREVRKELGASADVPVTFFVEPKSKPGVRGWGVPTLKVRALKN
jgi:hypothetical protein